MRAIVQNGHPTLRNIAKEIPLDEIGSSFVREIIADMKALLAKEEFGVAIAAPQVGESIRLFVVAGKNLIKDKRAKKKPGKEEDMDEEYLEGIPEFDEVYINPIVVRQSRKKTKKHEGCLSVRGTWGMVPRTEKMTLQAYDERGKKFERGASGFLAHIFQHEMDHLDGVLYIDKATEVFDEQSTDGH
ncbi:MAG: peptide deformylase [Minisyncoccia bacterium]